MVMKISAEVIINREVLKVSSLNLDKEGNITSLTTFSDTGFGFKCEAEGDNLESLSKLKIRVIKDVEP